MKKNLVRVISIFGNLSLVRLRYQLRSLWPDVGIKKLPKCSQELPKGTRSRFYLKVKFFNNSKRFVRNLAARNFKKSPNLVTLTPIDVAWDGCETHTRDVHFRALSRSRNYTLSLSLLLLSSSPLSFSNVLVFLSPTNYYNRSLSCGPMTTVAKVCGRATSEACRGCRSPWGRGGGRSRWKLDVRTTPTTPQVHNLISDASASAVNFVLKA